MASRITAAPISSGRVSLKVPFGALPTAVRTADTITASLIASVLLDSGQQILSSQRYLFQVHYCRKLTPSSRPRLCGKRWLAFLRQREFPPPDNSYNYT